jgi:hypothetical protein
MTNWGASDFAASVASERLTREVGLLAGRLAHFLAASLPQAEGALAEGQAFLHALFEAVANGSQPEPEPSTRLRDAVSPLDRLVTLLGLSEEEQQLLLLAGLPEEHEGLAAVLRTLHPRSESRASVGLAMQLLCRTPRDRLALRAALETGPLTRSGLVRLTGEGPFFERSLQTAEALWPVLHGIDVWPAGLRCHADIVATSGLEEWFAQAPTRRAAIAIARQEQCTVLVTAESEEVAFQRALALVHLAGLRPLGLLLPPAIDADLERLAHVHALARGGVPVLRLTHTDGAAPPEAPTLANYPGVVTVCGRVGAVATRGQRPLLAVPVDRLSSLARQQMWRELLPALAPQAALFAARYPVEPSTAAEVATDLRCVEAITGRSPTVDDVGGSLRARAGLSLSSGVKLIRPTATWDDLVLPENHLRQLHEAADRLALQSRVLDEWGFLKGRVGARGVRMLFAGPPGTGKTLAAEVLAQALSVDLFVVDISRVVSKWIGETEKNLAAVFDAAERAQAVLFFDEADALFGKRTEVSDAHDRYANLETAYLLARLERFEGLAILATNFRQNIDPAFLRRLEFVLDFAEPDREQRHALWRCHLPHTAPLADDVNLYELAALYPVVGGIIRNAAVAAGFLAAADGGPILRQHFIHAIRREYEKAGRVFPGVPLDMSVTR